MRSHADLAKKAEPMFQPACEYYAKLANPAALSSGKSTDKNKKKAPPPAPMAAYHTVDVFACSLDQVGMLEMRQLVEATGGLLLLGMIVFFIATYPDIPTGPWVFLAALAYAPIPFFLYPFSKTIWLAIDLLMRPVTDDEIKPRDEWT